MLKVNNLIGFGGSGVVLPPSEFSFLTSQLDATSQASYSFAGVSLGTANTDRKILVAITTEGGASAGSPSAVTVAGISATQIHSHTSGTGETVSFWIAPVPTGTSGTVAVTITGNNPRECFIAAYRLLYYQSSAYDTVSVYVTSNDVASGTIDCSASGVVVAAALGVDSAACTWAGVTENVEDLTGSPIRTTGSQVYSTAQAGLTVSATLSGGSPGSDDTLMAAIALNRGM